MTPQARALFIAIGKTIRKRRKVLKTSQAAIARILGMTRASMSNVEAGRQRVPLDKLYLLAGALGLTIADILPQIDKDEHLAKLIELERSRREKIAAIEQEIDDARARLRKAKG